MTDLLSRLLTLQHQFEQRAFEAKSRALKSKPRTIAAEKAQAQATTWYDAMLLLRKELDK